MRHPLQSPFQGPVPKCRSYILKEIIQNSPGFQPHKTWIPSWLWRSAWARTEPAVLGVWGPPHRRRPHTARPSAPLQAKHLPSWEAIGRPGRQQETVLGAGETGKRVTQHRVSTASGGFQQGRPCCTQVEGHPSSHLLVSTSPTEPGRDLSLVNRSIEKLMLLAPGYFQVFGENGVKTR